jgi:hypothetical protein
MVSGLYRVRNFFVCGGVQKWYDVFPRGVQSAMTLREIQVFLENVARSLNLNGASYTEFKQNVELSRTHLTAIVGRLKAMINEGCSVREPTEGQLEEGGLTYYTMPVNYVDVQPPPTYTYRYADFTSTGIMDLARDLQAVPPVEQPVEQLPIEGEPIMDDDYGDIDDYDDTDDDGA